MKESYAYKKLGKLMVECLTCEHKCKIQPDRLGICGVRQNRGGKLIALNYGRAVTTQIDRIEKKPLFNFMPGSLTYSIATVGCNLRCQYCQNYTISQYTKGGWSGKIIGDKLMPTEVVKNALKLKCPSISYTYTEPTIFLEYALDTMKIARKNNLKNIWVSNGYMSQKTLELIIPYLDAINVDLKAYRDDFYRRLCGARLAPVLKNLIELKKNEVHLEVTTLIIPAQNDSARELKQIAEFIKNKLGAATPWHVTAFYPAYKMSDLAPTARAKILEAQTIGRTAGLKFVYSGNI